MKSLILIGLSFLMVSSSAFSAGGGKGGKGPGSGNGGKGVMVEGKLYLFDLVEAGVEKDPYFDPSVTDTQAMQDEIVQNVTFAKDPSFPVALVAQKLVEVMRNDFVIGALMLKTLELYQWRLVDLDLMPLNDHRQDVKAEAKDLIQLARRETRSILISRNAWNMLDLANRTALIFHEIIYAFATPQKTPMGTFIQDIGMVQENVGFLFSEDMKSRDRLDENFYQILPKAVTQYLGANAIFLTRSYRTKNMLVLTPKIKLYTVKSQAECCEKQNNIWSDYADISFATHNPSKETLNNFDIAPIAIQQIGAMEKALCNFTDKNKLERVATVIQYIAVSFSIEQYLGEGNEMHSYIAAKDTTEKFSIDAVPGANADCKQTARNMFFETYSWIAAYKLQHDEIFLSPKK